MRAIGHLRFGGRTGKFLLAIRASQMSKDFFGELIPVLEGYIEDVNEAIKRRNGPDVTLDLYNTHVPTVLAGLLARQATLTTRLAQSPPLWDGHAAPLFLRAMVECLVSFKWIAIAPEQRAAEYIGYGLGQAKLMLSHLQKEIAVADDDRKDRLIQAATMQEAWILSQRLIQFVDVNLGSWTGSSIRKMCEEIGETNLYQYWFVPHSSCVHSTWQHVSIWNTRTCGNPLHLGHGISAFAAPDMTLQYVEQSANFFDMIVDSFDGFYKLDIGPSNLLGRLQERVAGL